MKGLEQSESGEESYRIGILASLHLARAARGGWRVSADRPYFLEGETAMAEDARISTALPSHPKTRKLHKRLGAQGCWSLVCLFLWVASNRWNGNLSGLSVEDIELAAEWNGEPGAFVNALIDVRFLEGSEGALLVHDWAQHNPWAAARGQRIEAAKYAAKKRWGKQRAYDKHAEGMQSAQIRNAPNPTQTHPNPNPERATTATALPLNFKANHEHEQLARERNINLGASFASFRDWHQSRGTQLVDWDSALMKWLRDEKGCAVPKPPATMPNPATVKRQRLSEQFNS